MEYDHARQCQFRATGTKRTPWNKGKLTGAKPPLRPKHVWSIRTKLQVEGRTRDLAMFNLAIDSKLRGCDVVALKVEDVAPIGYSVDRATVRQKKTGQQVRFELTSRPDKQSMTTSGPPASISAYPHDVRFTPDSDRIADALPCPKAASSRH
jgi:hypothetical protein